MTPKTLTGILLDEKVELSVHDLCHACSTSTEWVIELVEEGVLEPIGEQPIAQPPTHWRFSGPSLSRARAAMRMQQDLEINLAGVALALDLMEEIDLMRERLRRLSE
jgi:chaperone modulatory protein CbpM